MAKIENKTKENPKLEQNKLSDGRISLYLEYYLGREEKPVLDENGNQVYYEDGKMQGKPKFSVKHNRRKENLNLYLIEKPRTPADRQQNKETLDLAINFLDYFQSYIDGYTKKDLRMMQIAFSRFKDFLKEQYPLYECNIKPEFITKDMMVLFVDYLQSRSVGEGAKSIYQRFKKVIRYAIEHDVILKDLTYKNVDYSNKLLKFEQNKTKGHSSASGVVIPLNDGLLSIIGEPPADGNKDMLIFNLPSYESCCKSVKRWVKRSGIDKHISWHCARHSFAVNILNNGANIKTVASLLGHSGLKHTEKYTRAVDKLKEEAINSLPELKL